MRGYIRKRGNTYSFTIDIGKDEQGKRIQKVVGGFKKEKEAELACAKMITLLENGGYVHPSKTTLGEYLIEYMENHSKHEIRASSFQTQMIILKKRIIPAIGTIKLQKLTPLIIQKFYTEILEQGFKATYVKSMHAILKKALKRAFEWGMIEKDIASLIKSPRIPSPETTIWTRDEMNKFLSIAKERKLYVVYVLAIYTGMRKGEILALKWKDCDLDQREVTINKTLTLVDYQLAFDDPKTTRSKRIISLPEFAATCLKRHKAQQNQDKLKMGTGYKENDLVVATNEGNPLYPTSINADFNSIIKNTFLPKIRFHDLRHSHATLLLQMGENPKVVSERLGHAHIGTTLGTYSHILPNMQKNLADNFNLIMESPPERTDEEDNSTTGGQNVVKFNF
ncbi:Site-specific recombinase XerD [Thermoactinomyces sp. DSM 45891]|uniref:site-specific integrase n=1 Tax=Thermoactinomyces sp. DSM 45891 TaxID=1761907 RepID=UPI000917D57D|nr:site-specific integrase [Thermoactinomyces sp. DSM 45891]SFX82339.1 Site-specific recombinase XerD [Thermoactinomyces sp. DSM 45891]